MTEIIKNLYLGNKNDAIVMSDIGLVINCTTDIQFYSEENTHIRIPVLDNGNFEEHTKLYNLIEDGYIFAIMDNFLSENKKVLVHCRFGQQRSCAVVACFLIWKYNLDPFDAISFIKSKRRQAFFGSVNFFDTIKHYSKSL